jgi:ribosomal protein S12 methylthiotransferase
VVVTGCLGAEGNLVKDHFPDVLAVTGPQQYEAVIDAVHRARPPAHDPYTDLVPPQGVKLTPRHYAYLKISEGCNHRCSFCIIPRMRGDLVSRPAADVLREAERLVKAGVKELLVISQDTSAYGVDIRHAASERNGRAIRAHVTDLAAALGGLGAWVRLHYVYPYPHVDQLIPLMAEGKVLPYLDIPFQHASPGVLKAMRRPANQEKVLARIGRWRDICPDLAIRSTFIVGFPGETEKDFAFLLDWLEEAQLDRVGCFKFEPVDGAAANDLPDPVPEEVKQERWERFMEVQQRISETRLARQIGRSIEVIVDQVDDEGIVARSKMDAPEIDGSVFLDLAPGIAPGDIVKADIDEASEYDLYGTVAASAAATRPKPGQPKSAAPRRAAPKRRRAQ